VGFPGAISAVQKQVGLPRAGFYDSQRVFFGWAAGFPVIPRGFPLRKVLAWIVNDVIGDS
jgi:hypothetical protein